MQPWEKDGSNNRSNINSGKPFTAKDAIKHVGFGLGVAVLIYSSVIYQSIFMKEEKKENEKN